MWVYVYLPYSLAFLALGLVMAMTARAPTAVLPRLALWFLAGFGLFHGIHEWLEMAISIQQRAFGNGSVMSLRRADPFFTAVSFALVMQAGIEVLIALRQWPKWLRAIPGGLLLVWAGVLIAASQPLGTFASAEWTAAGDASARYLIGFPGSLLVAYSLLVSARAPREVSSARLMFYLRAAAVSFVLYALFTALGVPPAPFPPASLINTETFLAATGIPVEAFRAIFALAIAGFLAEACVVEAAWIQAQLGRLREEFTSVVVHDLRSPISSIVLAADALERLPSEGHFTDREFAMLNSIRRSADNLARMVADLLDASRIEAKRLILAKERVDLRSLVSEVVDRAREITKDRPVRVMVPDTVPPVEADPGRIEQVLLNLLSNAAKYSYPNTEIEVEVEVRHPEVVVSVRNYGPGIAPEEQALLFARFYRAKAAERARIPGLGLGLYIAKGLVQAHGGRMWVESKTGRSATFRFTLPCGPS